WCLLGVLALLGAGLLAFSGEEAGWAGAELGGEPRHPGSLMPCAAMEPNFPPRSQDWLQQPPLDPAGDPQSLHSMSLLLDKLAKENQDIRLLQAELQAQKDELQASVGSQQQSLAGENARLHQALQQAVEAQRSAQAELQVLREQVLREQLQGLAREGAAETPRPREGLAGYMAGLGWGQHYAGLAARLDGAFAGDGTFAHDRLRFRHFVEDVEELLEELAEREQGDEEAADDFEEYVLRHYGGDGFTQKERERRRAKHQSKELREHGPPRARDGHRGKENSPPDQG
uniref:PBX homeobox interacting protein 1 n=1 Tax=Chelydra serpentina TaxID=8475 RepID=A0A8C3SE53_CHESE